MPIPQEPTPPLREAAMTVPPGAVDEKPPEGTRPAATAAVAPAPRRWRPASVGRRIYSSVRLYAGALSALLIICVYLSVTQSFFLTKANVFNILTSNSDLFLVAIGLTFVILSAGFDLSVGPMVAAAGLVVYATLNAGLPTLVAIPAALGFGLAFGGLVNGSLIGKFRLNFFVVTLGTASLLSGLVDVLTNGQTETIKGSKFFASIGTGSVAGVPVPVWISLAALVLAALVLRHTPFGRAVYAVGGNKEAARLSGINVTLVLMLVYAVAGFGAALAGVVDASRLSSASPQSGATLALTAGAAVLLGGTSFFGGIGGVGGTVVGVLLIGVLQNGIGLMGVSAFWQGVVTGGVLIAAVALDRLQTRPKT